MKKMAISLTIAGSDSGGGAGIQADLKTFFALGVHGTSVITCVTAQNPSAVTAVQEIDSDVIEKQLEAVFNGLRPVSAKTGMLYSETIIKLVAEFVRRKGFKNLIIDPVMVSTSGSVLLKKEAIKALTECLIPLGKLLMPNLDEASVLLGQEIKTVEDLRFAARELNRRFNCGVLVKGGHLKGLKEAIDIFQNGREELMLKAEMIKNAQTHGTGCTYSAAVTAYLANGYNIQNAIIAAKKYVTKSIANRVKIGSFSALNWGKC